MAPPPENDGAAVIVAAFVGIASVSLSLDAVVCSLSLDIRWRMNKRLQFEECGKGVGDSTDYNKATSLFPSRGAKEWDTITLPNFSIVS